MVAGYYHRICKSSHIFRPRRQQSGMVAGYYHRICRSSHIFRPGDIASRHPFEVIERASIRSNLHLLQHRGTEAREARS
jgi:hypothetical protein